MNIIRKKQPKLNPSEKICLYEPEKVLLKNKIPLYIFKSDENVLKIKLTFKAGTYSQDKPLQAYLTNRLLNEGTKKYASKKIAEIIDYNGAMLIQNADEDYAAVSLLVLKKNVYKIIDVLSDIIMYPVFPVQNFKRQKDITLQNFIVNNEKVAVVAKKNILQAIFGSSNFYGYKTQIEDFEKISVDDVIKFHNDFYTPSHCSIFITGNIDLEQIKTLEKVFGDKDWKKGKITEKRLIIDTLQEKKIHVIKKDALQTGIRIGKVLFNRTHQDDIGMRFLNMALGGYFGSRLMSNIREDKGYTYGIYSGIVSLKNTGYFTIGAEVGKNVCKNALKEIYYEIIKLQNEKLGNKELELVKNYLHGQFLKNIDGQMNYANLYEIISGYGFDKNYLYKYYDEINQMTPERLLDLAQKYFDVETLYEVTAG